MLLRFVEVEIVYFIILGNNIFYFNGLQESVTQMSFVTDAKIMESLGCCGNAPDALILTYALCAI